MNRALVLIAGLSAGAVIGSTGCQNTDTDKNKVQSRSQIEDPVGELDAYTTVGTKTNVSNTDPVTVSGVGLVYGLPGTGSAATPGIWRSMLETTLKKQGLNVTQILDDPRKTTSLVLISAQIPPGARQGRPHRRHHHLAGRQQDHQPQGRQALSVRPPQLGDDREPGLAGARRQAVGPERGPQARRRLGPRQRQSSRRRVRPQRRQGDARHRRRRPAGLQDGAGSGGAAKSAAAGPSTSS